MLVPMFYCKTKRKLPQTFPVALLRRQVVVVELNLAPRAAPGARMLKAP